MIGVQKLITVKISGYQIVLQVVNTVLDNKLSCRKRPTRKDVIMLKIILMAGI